MICTTVFAPGLTSFVSKIDDIAVQVAGLFFDVAEEVDSHAVGVTKQHLTITVHHPDKHRLKTAGRQEKEPNDTTQGIAQLRDKQPML